MNTDETNTRYIQILQNDEKCVKTITVVLGTNCQKPKLLQKILMPLPHMVLLETFTSPKILLEIPFLVHTFPFRQKFWLLRISPLPLLNVQLPTLEWEWIFAGSIYTLIPDVSTTVYDTQ